MIGGCRKDQAQNRKEEGVDGKGTSANTPNNQSCCCPTPPECGCGAGVEGLVWAGEKIINEPVCYVSAHESYRDGLMALETGHEVQEPFPQ